MQDSPFSVADVQEARFKLFWSPSKTRIKPNDVLSLDDTLLIHYGQHFEKIANLFDRVSGAYVWAHNLVKRHYSDGVTDYPIDFQWWQPTKVDELEAGLKAAGRKIGAQEERSYKMAQLSVAESA